MKKILIVTSGFPLWETEGLNGFMLEFAQTVALDHEVFVLAPLSKKSKEYEKIGNIIVYRHKQFPIINAELAYGSGIVGNIKKNPFLLFVIPFFFLIQFLHIKKIVKKHKIDIVNSHWIIPQGVTTTLYKKLINNKIKTIATVHGSDYNALNNIIGNSLKRFVLKNTDTISVVSQTLYDAIIQNNYKNVFLCPVGVNTVNYSPEKSSQPLLKELDCIDGYLLYVGALIEGKGIRYLINAMEKIVKTFPNLKLVVIGEGYLEKELKQIVSSLNITHNVIFKGKIPNSELPPYFASCKIFILPSFSEGFPIVIKEAMSSGSQIIVTDLPVFSSHPILKEVLFKVNIADANSITEKVVYVLNNQESLQHLKSKSRDYILNTSSWGKVREIYKDLTLTI